MTRIWIPGDGQRDDGLPVGARARRTLIIVDGADQFARSLYTIGQRDGSIVLRQYNGAGNEMHAITIASGHDKNELRNALEALRIAGSIMFTGAMPEGLTQGP